MKPTNFGKLECFFLQEKQEFEQQLCNWVISGLDQKSIFKIVVDMEDKHYATILKDAILGYVASNIAVLGKQPQMHSLPKPILVEVLNKLNL